MSEKCLDLSADESYNNEALVIALNTISNMLTNFPIYE